MGRVSLVRLYSLIVLVFAAHGAWALTYQVGGCKPRLRNFTTIGAALAATPAPDVVQVCPGTYPEQIEITQGVTLEGIASGNSEQAIIAVPSGGLMVNASLGGTIPFAAQLWVNNATGPVTVQDITVDGTGIALAGLYAGIFYQNSAGTVNRVATRNQSTGNGQEISVEGGASNPSVTVQNSSVHDFEHTGIYADSFGGGLDLTVKGNNVSNPNGSGVGIGTLQLTTVKIANNVVTGTGYGIQTNQGTGSISGNTVANFFAFGITPDQDGIAVTGNEILNGSSVGVGIVMLSAGVTIRNNSITNTLTGIEFECVANGNVQSNTIMDAATGLSDVPPSVTTTNSYFNVGILRSGGGC
jgi:hypothetical protein